MVLSETSVHPPLLRVHQLSKRFGDESVLSDVSFDLGASEIVGLIGPNGAGKTTLLECVAGLLPLDSGNITTRDGGPPRGVAMYIPDGVSPYPELFAADVLMFFGEAHGVANSEWERLIDRLNLLPVLGKRVAALSKGNLKRFLLALALLAPYPVLLIDEPFSGLDLEQMRAVSRLLREVPVTGRTLMLAIHELAHAEQACDRLLLLNSGQLVGAGTLGELRESTQLPGGELEDVFLALTRADREEGFLARH